MLEPLVSAVSMRYYGIGVFLVLFKEHHGGYYEEV